MRSDLACEAAEGAQPKVAGDAPARRVLVTGGASGIGRAIVDRLSSEAFKVDHTRWRSGGEAGIACDLSNADEVEAMCAGLASSGPFFGLVHNAGVATDALAPHVDPAAARRAMEINFWSLVSLVKHLSPAMLRARRGRIVVVGSIAAERGSRGNSIYAATKAALQGYVRCCAQEFAPRGVTVNVVAPGWVDTPMLAPYAAAGAQLQDRVPMKRLGAPDDVAAAVAFLLGPGAAYVSGATLAVDGALSAGLG